MKFLLVLLLALSTPVLALDNCMTGSYYDPDFPGQGINVEALENSTLVYFYNADGTWLLLQGKEDFDLKTYQNAFGEPHLIGDGYIEADGYNAVWFGYVMGLDLRDYGFYRPTPWCLRTDCEVDYKYVRLTQPIPCDVE